MHSTTCFSIYQPLRPATRRHRAYRTPREMGRLPISFPASPDFSPTPSQMSIHSTGCSRYQPIQHWRWDAIMSYSTRPMSQWASDWDSHVSGMSPALKPGTTLQPTALHAQRAPSLTGWLGQMSCIFRTAHGGIFFGPPHSTGFFDKAILAGGCYGPFALFRQKSLPSGRHAIMRGEDPQLNSIS